MTVASQHRVVLLLMDAGYLSDFLEYNESGDTLLGVVKLDLIEKLKADERFANGVFYGYHRDVGNDLIDFRSYNGKLCDGSLQLVIDRKTGRCYADVDAHNPYNDLARIFGHLFLEVIPGWFRWKRKTA